MRMFTFKTFAGIILAVGIICMAANAPATEPSPPLKVAMGSTSKQPSQESPASTPTPAGAPAAPASSPDQSAGDNKDKGKNCIWTCLQWTQQCDVDPRGVYKCNRVCAQFGQQCE